MTFCTHFPKYPENGHFWVFCENGEKWGFFKPRKWRKPESGAQICGDPRRIIYCLDTRSGPQKRGFWGFCENPCFGGTAKPVRTRCAGGCHTPRHTPDPGGCTCTPSQVQDAECVTFGIRTYMIYIYGIRDTLGTAEKFKAYPTLNFFIESPKYVRDFCRSMSCASCKMQHECAEC